MQGRDARPGTEYVPLRSLQYKRSTANCPSQTCSPGSSNGSGSGELTCGPLYNNHSCPVPEQCCSESGYCGTGKDYCQSPQCLLGFGKCDASIMPSGRNTTWVDRSQYSKVRIQINGEDIDYGTSRAVYLWITG